MLNRNLVKFLSFRYVILAVVFVILAGGLVVLPKFNPVKGIEPTQLLNDAISPERYISTDELADRLINQDPSILLIDVRSKADYDKYALPGALHVPFKSMLNDEFDVYIDQDDFDVIFYSNDNLIADQAWILSKRLDYKNIHVLKGGMNEWYRTIINPEKPEEIMASNAYDLYAFRKAASMFFGVAYPQKSAPIKVQPKPVVVSKPKVIVPKKKKKKMPVEGGC